MIFHIPHTQAGTRKTTRDYRLKFTTEGFIIRDDFQVLPVAENFINRKATCAAGDEPRFFLAREVGGAIRGHSRRPKESQFRPLRPHQVDAVVKVVTFKKRRQQFILPISNSDHSY